MTNRSNMSARDITWDTFLKVDVFAKSLIHQKVDVLHAEDSEIVSRLYNNGGSEMGLILWHDEQENILKQQVCLYGQVVEWNILQGVLTGVIVDDEKNPEDECLNFKDLLVYDKSPSKPSVLQAIEFINHVPELNLQYKQELLKNLKTGDYVNTLGADEFLTKFGFHSGRPSKNSKSWAQKIANFFNI